jgi:cytidylate kinase
MSESPAIPPEDVVAIDGPAGAGKSTVSREIARRLGFRFLDTGAMYRAATWWCMQRGVDWANPEAVAAATHAMPLELRENDGQLHVFVDGRDISHDIRTTEVTNNIRRLDGNAAVRETLVRIQRDFARRGPTVAEGRDMGTIVFPGAKCKIFLDASPECRAKRRALQLESQGISFDPETLRHEIETRDANDRNRAVAPLRQAADAWRLDTSGLTEEQVIDAIMKRVKEAFA